MPAEVVIHVVVVPVVLPQLRVLGVLGGRVPVVLGELLELVVLLVDLVVGLALLRGLRVLRGERGVWESVRRVDVASSMRGRALIVFAPLCTAGFFASLAASALGLSLMFWSSVLVLWSGWFGPDIAFWLGSGRSSEQMA